MVKALKYIWHQLNRSIFVGDRLQSNIKAISYVGLAISFCSMITTVMNLLQGTYFMAATTAIFCIIGIIAYITCHFYGMRLPSAYGILFACIVLMTYYSVSGANEGFAILWTMIVPAAVMFLGSVKLGIGLSLYYLCLFAVLFYTPLRSHFVGRYTVTFMNRYPIVYLCAILINSTAMIRYHISVLRDMEYQDKLASEVQRLTAMEVQRRIQMEQMSLQMIETLANAIDAKDKYTNGHSRRVSEYAVLLARKLGWSEERIQALKYEASLHDVGKIGIPDAVLNKDSRLTNTEYKIIQFHAFLGGEILSGADTIPGAKDVAKYHHERIDGKGYPEGLKGTQIPEDARIVCIADSFDAMSSDRVYRKALPRQVILQELKKGRGTQFDAHFLDVFLQMYENGELDPGANREQAEPSPAISPREMHALEEAFDRNFDLTGQTVQGKQLPEQAYEYLQNLYQGTHLQCSIVLISMNPTDSSQDTPDHYEKAALLLETAINQTGAKNQMWHRCSKTQYLLVTQESEPIDLLMQSIYVNFYKLTDGSAYEFSYQVISSHRHSQEPSNQRSK